MHTRSLALTLSFPLIAVSGLAATRQDPADSVARTHSTPAARARAVIMPPVMIPAINGEADPSVVGDLN